MGTWYNEYGPTLDEVPFINKPMQVTYNYNEIDQLTYEFGQEELKGYGYGSPYEIYYDYDADGNLTEKTLYKGWSSYPPTAGSEKVTTYTYDAEDRLTGIQFPNNQTNSFYDCICGAKQMEWTDASGEITRYFLDGDQVLFEYDGNNQIKARYTNGPGIDEKISMTRYTPNSQKTTSNSSGNRATYYYHYDALGSVTAMTDEKGKVVETYDYDPFGVIIDHDRNVTKNLYTYTGRNYIPDAGMYGYRNRTYFPGLGRFGQVDPLLHQPSGVSQTTQSYFKTFTSRRCSTVSQSTIQIIPTSIVSQNVIAVLEHPYVYVRNNPINLIDPSGLGPVVVQDWDFRDGKEKCFCVDSENKIIYTPGIIFRPDPIGKEFRNDCSSNIANINSMSIKRSSEIIFLIDIAAYWRMNRTTYTQRFNSRFAPLEDDPNYYISSVHVLYEIVGTDAFTASRRGVPVWIQYRPFFMLMYGITSVLKHTYAHEMAHQLGAEPHNPTWPDWNLY